MSSAAVAAGTPSSASSTTHPARSATPIRPPVVQPQASTSRRGGGPQSIIVNGCQRGNTILDHVKHVAWEYGQIIPDYQVGATTCVLFLSLKYHRLHPEYLHNRIQKLGNMYLLRILLLMCDVTEHQEPIREITKICLINNMTVMVAWTPEEAGQYLATYKMFEHKPPDRIKERVDKDYTSMLRSTLTSIRGVNKTDVTTLNTNIGSLAEIAEASSEQLLQCPGFGEVKARRVHEAFQKPFRNNPFSAQKKMPFSSAQRATPSQPTPTAPSAGPSNRSPPHPASSTTALKARAPHPASLVWDIELDLNESEGAPSPELPPPRPAATLGRAPRPPSPIWDIELDLNDSDVELSEASGPPQKRSRPNPTPEV